MIPHPTTLEGHGIRLVPLAEDHIPALMEISRSAPDEYRFTSTPVTEAQQEAYFALAFEERRAGRAYAFTVLDREGTILGTTRFADIVWRHRNCELGYTWYHPSVFGTAVNPECKYLMLRFAFEELSFLRVQIHTDVRNLRSQAAIRALGALYEGIFRRHQIAKDGYIRDTMVFAITDLEWPGVRTRLVERLARKGVAAEG